MVGRVARTYPVTVAVATRMNEGSGGRGRDSEECRAGLPWNRERHRVAHRERPGPAHREGPGAAWEQSEAGGMGEETGVPR
jgi:hypothetical protein